MILRDTLLNVLFTIKFAQEHSDRRILVLFDKACARISKEDRK